MFLSSMAAFHTSQEITYYIMELLKRSLLQPSDGIIMADRLLAPIITTK